jgi:hypothetical protein
MGTLRSHPANRRFLALAVMRRRDKGQVRACPAGRRDESGAALNLAIKVQKDLGS